VILKEKEIKSTSKITSVPAEYIRSRSEFHLAEELIVEYWQRTSRCV
jgi:hypothetical protein